MIRLSDHFLLLDFLYSQPMIDCVVHHRDLVANRIDSIGKDSVEYTEGRYLCDTILERIVAEHGPVSIAAGLWFSDIKGFGGAFSATGPHKWMPETGAAADIVVHSWVNDEKSPAKFLGNLHENGIKYHRALSFKGSEFCCIASRNGGNKGALTNGGLKTNWRRKPYAHNHGFKLKHKERYEHCLREAESIWSKDTANRKVSDLTGTVVYAREPVKNASPPNHSIVEIPKDAFHDHPNDGMQLVRPWHVRVSRNFVLFDFCRNESMFKRGLVTVPPLSFRTANSVILVARMFGEILDPVKEYLGSISVVRGMEPKGFSNDKRSENHRWIPEPDRIHSLEFVTPINPRPGFCELLAERVYNLEVSPDSVYGGDRVRVDIRNFTPRRCYTSATGDEYAWKTWRSDNH